MVRVLVVESNQISEPIRRVWSMAYPKEKLYVFPQVGYTSVKIDRAWKEAERVQKLAERFMRAEILDSEEAEALDEIYSISEAVGAMLLDMWRHDRERMCKALAAVKAEQIREELDQIPKEQLPEFDENVIKALYTDSWTTYRDRGMKSGHYDRALVNVFLMGYRAGQDAKEGARA